MTLIKKHLLAASVALTLTFALFFLVSLAMNQVRAASTQVPGVTLHTINPPTGTQDFYTFFTSTSTTATSTTAASSQDPGFFRIGGATEVLFYFSRGDAKGTGNSGSSLFKVQVTPDGVNWVDYAELGQVVVSSTADVFFTRVSSTTLPAGTSTAMYAMEDINFYGVRCITVRTTDGDASCKATANF